MINIMGNIEKALTSDKIGQLIGALATEQVYGKGAGYGDFLANIDAQLGKLEDLHIPDIDSLRYNLLGEGYGAKVFKTSVYAAIFGELLKELKLHPQMTKIGRVASSLGTNAAIGSALVTLIQCATIFHSTPAEMGGSGKGLSSGNSPSWGYTP